MSSVLRSVVQTRRLVICCGPGGTGKTTTSAALGVAGAKAGRRVVVLTIDPARRLADALGIDGLTNEPTEVVGVGSDGGSLWAMQLDARDTFDEIVRTWSTEPAQAERILTNPYYRTIAGSLSGTQEYMAGEKLLELHQAGFDLVVVDTPPGRHAVDFLDASRRLVAFFDHRLYRTVLAPRHGLLRAVNLAAQAFLRSAARVVGAELIADAVDFFAAFEGMEDDFRARSVRVQALLGDPATAFVVVTSPRPDTIDAAIGLIARLAAEGRATVDAVVVNRVSPRFGPATPAEDRRRSDEYAGTPLGALFRTRAELHERATADEAGIDALRSSLDQTPVLTVPALPDDVHDLRGLAEVASHMVA